MASTPSVRRREDPELNLKDWALKARISRENSRSRRFSGSNVPSFREDPRPSFRTNLTISSTASSPGYTVKEEIDPSTYSFSTALKALQAKTVYTWEYMSPDGYALNSKWDEAEKYICNPLSGEVPLECLSSKTLSARSFRNLTSRITMSAPLIYPSNSHLPQFQTMPCVPPHEKQIQIHTQEKKIRRRSMTRDIGTQSMTPELLSSISSSPSPAPTPSIEERSIKHDPDSPISGDKLTCDMMQSSIKSESDAGWAVEKLQEKGEDCTKTAEQESERGKSRTNKGGGRKTVKKMCKCKQGGCLSLWSLWLRRRDREKHKPKPNKKISVFSHHKSGC